MNPYKITFEIPGVPERLNVTLRKHWAARRKIYQEWYKSVYLATLGKTPQIPLTKCKITITRFSSRKLDFDGMVGSYKPVVDGLVHARIILDDKWDITGPWSVDQMFVPRGKEWSRITVESI